MWTNWPVSNVPAWYAGRFRATLTLRRALTDTVHHNTTTELIEIINYGSYTVNKKYAITTVAKVGRNAPDLSSGAPQNRHHMRSWDPNLCYCSCRNFGLWLAEFCSEVFNPKILSATNLAYSHLQYYDYRSTLKLFAYFANIATIGIFSIFARLVRLKGICTAR